jgi:hypothetical protein
VRESCGEKKAFGPEFDRSRFDKDFALMLYVPLRCCATETVRRSVLELRISSIVDPEASLRNCERIDKLHDGDRCGSLSTTKADI